MTCFIVLSTSVGTAPLEWNTYELTDSQFLAVNQSGCNRLWQGCTNAHICQTWWASVHRLIISVTCLNQLNPTGAHFLMYTFKFSYYKNLGPVALISKSTRGLPDYDSGASRVACVKKMCKKSNRMGERSRRSLRNRGVSIDIKKSFK